MATAIVEVNCSICEKLALLAICQLREHRHPVHYIRSVSLARCHCDKDRDRPSAVVGLM
jgi:hypothetical protein